MNDTTIWIPTLLNFQETKLGMMEGEQGIIGISVQTSFCGMHALEPKTSK